MDAAWPEAGEGGAGHPVEGPAIRSSVVQPAGVDQVEAPCESVHANQARGIEGDELGGRVGSCECRGSGDLILGDIHTDHVRHPEGPHPAAEGAHSTCEVQHRARPVRDGGPDGVFLQGPQQPAVA